MRNSIFDAAGMRVFERGWLSSNNVLFEGRHPGGAVLVDSGYGSHADQTLALVRRALGGRPLDRIINTHLHSDHCGGNHALQRAFDCQIDIPEGEVDKVDRWDEALLTYRDTGQECPRFLRTGSIRAGDQIALGTHPWRVIAAPGHDPESVVLYQPELQLLISADALWEDGFGVIFPELEGSCAFDAVRQTLDLLAELPVRWVIPGHGAPFQGVGEAISRASSRLAAFVADPPRHARHAAKVLIKFHLLDKQRRSRAGLQGWLETTRYIRLSHAAHFGSTDFAVWCRGLIEELALAGVLRIDGEWVWNV